ncbi:MAG: nicotinate phosphoribosyltransferase [Candidatus Omnitrophica bacterium]|nr:nicotinate phosphoribosyltransferase [Candidatus Omnitrophota bacterium]
MDKRHLADGILFTDFYQLTMAQLFYRNGLHQKTAQFDYFFRRYPDYGEHRAGYCICAGLENLLEWMEKSRFGKEEIQCLRNQKGRAGERLFGDDFLHWLQDQNGFDGINLAAIPEGRVVHPEVPLAIVKGPLALAQILESTLLNHLNFQTLIATKACRIKESSCCSMLIDFGMRRAPGLGANAATRAALIGGADFSSNTGESCLLGYPPKGTHAHSMVQVFTALGAGELAAFRAYADIYPDDCLLLVDTIDTLHSGVPHAITVFEELKRKGHKPVGIRLDSGDLAYLAIQSAKMLNEAGFNDATIVLSNQLDEMVIWQITDQIRKEARSYGVDPEHLIGRLSYGVGTRLVTSSGDAALDGIYKLTAVRDHGPWIPSIKLSETPAKTINPGDKSVWRIYDSRERAFADYVAREDEDPRLANELILHHPTQDQIHETLHRDNISEIEPLLIDVLKDGRRVNGQPTIEDMRRLRQKDLDKLDPGVRRPINPHRYHVSLSKELWELKQRLAHQQK